LTTLFAKRSGSAAAGPETEVAPNAAAIGVIHAGDWRFVNRLRAAGYLFGCALKRSSLAMAGFAERNQTH
jgi:hypothetical protein